MLAEAVCAAFSGSCLACHTLQQLYCHSLVVLRHLSELMLDICLCRVPYVAAQLTPVSEVGADAVAYVKQIEGKSRPRVKIQVTTKAAKRYEWLAQVLLCTLQCSNGQHLVA